MNSIVTLTQVKKTYRLGSTTVEALRGANLELERGKYYSIVGPSGSGKSTLLHIVGCMDTPTSGEVVLNGQSLQGLREKALTKVRARQIGFVFQAFHLNPILTAQDNIAMSLRFLGTSKREAHDKATFWLDRVSLSHRARHYPSELSGGERQRVAIARAIAKHPVLILADEPTGNLDSVTSLEIISLLREINREHNTTIIQVTHNHEIAAMSDAIVTLRDGAIVER